MSNNESKRPFADQVLEYAGVQVGDIWLDKQYAEVIKVLYIRDTDDAHPILVTGEDHVNTFINESYFSENCTLVERGGQVVEQWEPFSEDWLAYGCEGKTIRAGVYNNRGKVLKVVDVDGEWLVWVHWDACRTHSVEPIISLDFLKCEFLK